MYFTNDDATYEDTEFMFRFGDTNSKYDIILNKETVFNKFQGNNVGLHLVFMNF